MRNVAPYGVLIVVVVALMIGTTAAVPIGLVGASDVTSTEDGIEFYLEPSDSSIEAGDVATFDVVVEGADEVSAFDFDLELSDSEVATIEDFDLDVDANIEDVDVTDNRVNVSVATGIEPIDASGTFVIGSLTVVGDTDGSADIDVVDGVDGPVFTDPNDEEYEIDSVSGASLTVEGEITDPAVSITPTEAETNVDDPVPLTVHADVLSNGLSSYSLTVAYDDGNLSASEENVTTHIGSPTEVSVSEGEITIEADADESDALEDVNLTEIEFSGQAFGDANVSIESIQLVDSDGATYDPRSIAHSTVNVLPEEVDTSIEFRLDDEEIDAGESVTGDIVVVGPSNGISAYELAINSEDTDVAEFTDIELTGDPQFPDDEITEDGATATIDAGMGDNAHGPDTEITIATVTLTGVSEGTVDLEFDQDARIFDPDDNEYDIDSVDGDTLSVEGEITDPVVRIVPEEIETEVDEHAQFAVEASDLVSDLTEFSYTVSVDDTIVDVDESDVSVPGATDVDVNVDAGTIDVSAIREDPIEDETADVGLINITGLQAGETDVTVDSVVLENEDGIAYDPREVTGGFVQVRAEGETAIEFRLHDNEIDAGELATGDLVVVNAPDGISAYDITLTSDDGDVAKITDIDLAADPQFPDSSVSDDGSTATISAGMGADPHDGAAEITLATVTIEGVGEGSSTFELGPDAQITNVDDGQYDIESMSGDTVSVVGELTDPVVQVVPESAETEVGESAEFAVEASDLVAGLSDISYTLSIDNTIVDVEEEDVSVPDASDVEVTVDDGQIDVIATRDAPIEDEQADLGVIELTGVGIGESPVAIETITLSDDDGNEYEPRQITDGAVTVLSGEPGVDVEIEFPSETVAEGNTITGDVIVRNADTGVGAYDMVLTLSDTDLAVITELDPTENPAFDSSEIVDNGTAVLEAGMGDNVHDSGDVVIATVTLEAVAPGSASLDIEEPSVADAEVTQYEILSTEGASLTIEESIGVFEIGPLDDRRLSTSQVDDVAFSAEITNVGDSEDIQPVELYIDDELIDSENVELTINETETITFESISLTQEPGEYEYRIETPADTQTGNLTIIEGPPPIVGDNLPQDLNGDGLFEDVTGSGQLDIFDVQALHANIESENVQEYSEFFNFSELDSETVDIFDVQTLHQMTD